MNRAEKNPNRREPNARASLSPALVPVTLSIPLLGLKPLDTQVVLNKRLSKNETTRTCMSPQWAIFIDHSEKRFQHLHPAARGIGVPLAATTSALERGVKCTALLAESHAHELFAKVLGVVQVVQVAHQSEE